MQVKFSLNKSLMF